MNSTVWIVQISAAKDFLWNPIIEVFAIVQK